MDITWLIVVVFIAGAVTGVVLWNPIIKHDYQEVVNMMSLQYSDDYRSWRKELADTKAGMENEIQRRVKDIIQGIKLPE